MHDCDVLIPLVDEHVARLRDIDRDHLLAFDGDPSALATTPNRTRYRGLEGLVAFSEARRQLRYAEFVEHWDRLLASQFRERVEAVLVDASATLVRHDVAAHDARRSSAASGTS